MLALLAMNLASFAQIAQKLSRERGREAAVADSLFVVFADRDAVASAALIAGRTLLSGVATNLLFNAYVRRLYNHRKTNVEARSKRASASSPAAAVAAKGLQLQL